MTTPLIAHGLAIDVEEIPLPIHVFYWAAAVTLIVSFVLLAVGMRTPRPRDHQPPALPNLLQRLLTPRWGVPVLCAIALAWLLVIILTFAFGSGDALTSPIPNLVFVTGWIGLPIAAFLLGRAALHLHPVAALARIAGMEETRPDSRAARVGVWSAVVGITIFVWLELVYPAAEQVSLLGTLVIAWTVLGLALASSHGVRRMTEHLDPFGAYARLMASLAPWQRRSDGRLGIRMPLLGANRDVAGEPGLVALVTLLIGSVSFDGLSRTGWFSSRMTLAAADLGAGAGPLDADAARIVLGSVALGAVWAAAWLLFEGASWAARVIGDLRTGRASERAAQAFAPSLLPIAFAYVIAHYFAFFVVQVQDLLRLASDPFGRDMDLFGTAERTFADLAMPGSMLVWGVQVGAIVVGHVAALLLAHERALELVPERADGTPDVRRAVASQLPMLVLMLAYTVGGLYFLSEGLG